MGLQIGEIVHRNEIEFSDLKGKTVAVDAFNTIYQFLSSIRQPDGTPLMDSKKNVTSHLSGLFYRNVNLLAEEIKLIYVFDGVSDVLKGKEKERRAEAKSVAEAKYKEAVDGEDVDGMGKYSRRFVRLDNKTLEESKELLEAMGIAVVQAPSEGEMQCAKLVNDGEAWAISSQDYDAVVVGGKRLIQNLTMARTRKTRSGIVKISPAVIEYEKVLNGLGIDGDQLISLAILVGTDFNPGGVRGLGPKKALTLVRDKKFPVRIFHELEEQGKLDFDWKKVFELFKKPKVEKVKVRFPKLDEEKIKEILVERHEFSEIRVDNQLAKLNDLKKKAGQSTLF